MKNRTFLIVKQNTLKNQTGDNRRRFFDALYVMFSDNKIPYPGRTWKNLEEPGRTWKNLEEPGRTWNS